MGSLDFGAAAAAIVVVVDEVVEVVDVLEVELVVVERCVVVVLRCVVVVCGACVVVGAGAAVVVGATVVVVGVSVVGVVGGGSSAPSAPAVPSPNAKVPIINASAATARAAIEARRGADGRITSLTLDRRCLLAWSVIRLGGRLPLMLRAGIGRSTADGAAQQHRAISRAGAATMSRILKIAHM
ncbi:unannotated protein [freshwater metagenome]|uniref:Unannotated protein n=1 Tax=freshwater metagenome TaxID=449393 RepID=A0A6J7IE80_9ZZZZ